MDLLALLAELTREFRASALQDPAFQIYYSDEDPRPLAETCSRDAASFIKSGVLAETEEVYTYARRAAYFAPKKLKCPETEQDIDDSHDDPLSAESWGLQTIHLIENPSTVDKAYSTARAAAVFGEMANNGWREVGPVFEVDARKPVYRAFRALAASAARATNLVTNTAGDKEAVRAWCKELRARGYFGQFSMLKYPGEDSARLCEEFRRAARAQVLWSTGGDHNDAQPTGEPLLLETKEQRREAVTQKLAGVSKELDLFPPLKHDTEFWKVSPYTDRGAFEDWIEIGGPKSADDAFRAVLAMDSPSYYRRLQSWPERRKLAEQKKT